MARINLLPWRDELREERKRQFVMILLGMLVLAAGLVFLGGQFIDGLQAEQGARNSYLKKEIGTLDERINKVREISTQRQQLLGRMQVIQDLQSNRSVMPRLFDQLVRTLPDGVYYSSLTMQGQHISINGFADSNSRVSTLMRNLDASEWLTEPTLSGVKAVENGKMDGQSNQFQLAVRMSQPPASEVQGDAP